MGLAPRGVWRGPDCHASLQSSAFWLSATCPGGLFVFKRAVRALFAVPKQLKSRVGLKSDATLKTDRGG